MKKLKSFFRPNFFTLLTIAFGFYAFGPFAEQQKSVSVAADKMNVFYIGVENPITVAVEGIPDEVVKVHSDQVKLDKVGIGKYNVIATRPGTVKILVYGDGFETAEFEFRVKRIPDPVLGLITANGNLLSATEMTADEFKKAIGLDVFMEGFLFDIDFKIISYKILKTSRNKDIVELEVNTADKDSAAKVKALINTAEEGDVYYFTNSKCRYMGETNSRYLNDLVYKIK